MNIMFSCMYHLTVLPENLIPKDGSGIPRFGKQVIGRNKLAQIISDMCQDDGILGWKTGHSSKATCATSHTSQNFSGQVIKECTGNRSLESLHKYNNTGSDQQHEVSMALLPKFVSSGKKVITKENNASWANVPGPSKQQLEEIFKCPPLCWNTSTHFALSLTLSSSQSIHI